MRTIDEQIAFGDDDEDDCICIFPELCSGLSYVSCEGCGGDQCVCTCGGETDCPGCDECESNTGSDDGEESGEDGGPMSARCWPAMDQPQNSEVDRLRARVEELLAMNNAARKATTMQHRVRLWADSLWPDRTVPDKLTKLHEEALELASHTSPYNLREEAADCAIVLFDLAAVAGFDLLNAIEAKMAKNVEKHGGLWK